MLPVLTPNKEALSRSISIRASGLVKRKFTSAIWKTGLSFTFCINVGRNSCSLSKVGAWHTAPASAEGGLLLYEGAGQGLFADFFRQGLGDLHLRAFPFLDIA